MAGSDLVIATIGAGLRPFTDTRRSSSPTARSSRPSDFLEEVQARVLNAVLAKVHGLADGVGSDRRSPPATT